MNGYDGKDRGAFLRREGTGWAGGKRVLKQVESGSRYHYLDSVRYD